MTTGPVITGERAPDAATDFQNAAREPYAIKDITEAIRKKDTEKLRVILASKEVKDLNACDEHQMTPVFRAITADSVECLWQLLAAGASAKTQSRGMEETPISYAVVRHHASVPVVKVLLQYGADPNVKSREDDKLPVLQAALQGKETILNLLLDAGADIEGTDNSGQTAAMYAARKGHTGILRILIERGANIEKHGGQFDYCPLIEAVLNQRRDAFELLLESGASPAATCKNGGTVLMYAAWTGSVSAIGALAKLELDLDTQKKDDGCSALMWAVLGSKKYAVEKLLELGADPCLRNNEGKSAANLARENGHDDIAALIEAKALLFVRNGQKVQKPFRITLGAKHGQ
ncbi:MAG: ankyrin repeat domain-containing protein [Alphaproteobacteria bacterium]